MQPVLFWGVFAFGATCAVGVAAAAVLLINSPDVDDEPGDWFGETCDKPGCNRLALLHLIGDTVLVNLCDQHADTIIGEDA